MNAQKSLRKLPEAQTSRLSMTRLLRLSLLQHIATLAVAACLITVPGFHPSTLAQESTDQPEFSDSDLEFFETKIRPLLVEKCFECHGPESKPLEGGLSLGSRKAMLLGGDTGPAIEVGNAKESLLVDAINYGEVYEMPPDTKMADDEIALITKWVEMGAPWPAKSDVLVERAKEFDLEKRKAEHWCWQPVKKHPVPSVKDTEWPRDSIDNFILKKIEGAGLKPAKPADRRTLIRRAYFDLIGLPPTPEQVQAFVDDKSADAFEKVIDELLDNPGFGERWARHWMDLMRYAETYGHEFDYPIEHAYQYRDYLIRAFNEDVPYDELIEEHIAGDLLKKPRRNPESKFNESIIGTGNWFLCEAKHGPVDVRLEEAGYIDNRIDVMTKSFLGLTVACARCHDHKFDAISTEDYYALAGFQQSSRRQIAMLDPNQEIEKSFEATSKLVKQGDRITDELARRLRKPDKQQMVKYFAAAMVALQLDDSWTGKSVRFEEDKLKVMSASGGETKIQTLQRQHGLTWGGNKQLWWLDAKKDDVAKFAFTIPENDTMKYTLSGDFTKAPDYGIFDISLNGKPLKSGVDFYAKKLAKTGPFRLGNVALSSGEHVLEFKVVGHHKKAIPRHMVGIDWLQLQPVSDGKSTELAVIAKKHKVDSDLLGRFINAIKSQESGKKPQDALAYFRSASKTKKEISNQLGKQIANEAKQQSAAFKKWLADSTLFEDFNDGLPKDWFQTGFAFNNGCESESRFASLGSMKSSGTVHSGVNGGKYFGVLRSPTFEIEHDQIHLRVRGSKTTVRLIIDGYFMDSHSALLFKDAKVNLKASDRFVWQSQKGDIKNHKGHRAHLEIIDHGDGFTEVDEIRFSNGAAPTDKSALGLIRGKAGDFHRSEFFKGISTQISEQLKDGSQSEELIGWIIQAKLVEVFCNPQLDSQNSLLDSKRSTQFVSANEPRRDYHMMSNMELATELKSVRDQILELNAKTKTPMMVLGITDGTPEDEHIFIRGNHKTLGKIAVRRYLSAASTRPLNPPNGSGRLQLAKKITAPNNPLTSRVAANRLWHHLMGQGIVASVDNFGVLGKKPTHPELLDHLAKGLVSEKWSIKKMLRRIMLTQTYQMDSKPNPAAVTIDPDNNLLHRSRIKRLQGEAIRDSILKVSGELNPQMFGQSVPVYLTKFMSGRGRPRESGPLDGDGRRSIYIKVRRNFLHPMMLAFDTPIPFNSIGKRNQSNVPAQALILMNDPFVTDQAQKWSDRLTKEDQTIEGRIESIYLHAFGRPPAEWETEKAIEFVNRQAEELKLPTENVLTEAQIWRDFCHVVFNVKEFIFIK